MTESSPKPKRTGLLIWMIVSQILAAASLVLWALTAGLAFMAFDSGVTREAWIFVIGVWLYPVFPLVMVIAAWIAFAKRKNKLAAILSGLSFLPPVLFFLAMWVLS